jgi:diacylglycerol kinase family enzyme
MGDQLVGTAEAVAVLCPLVSRMMKEDEPSLEAAAVEPIAAGALFRLAFHTLFDDWRNDPSVSLARVTQIQVDGQGHIPAILDGEKVRIARNVLVEFVPRAFRALVPNPPHGEVLRVS